jgi:hypothetical protein
MVAQARYGASVIALALLACDGTVLDTPGSGSTDSSEGGGDTGIEVTPADTSPDSGAPDDTGEETPCGELAPDEAGWAALFDANSVHAVELSLSDEAITELGGEPGSYAQAEIVVDGTALSGVALKMRGSGDTQRWDGKPNFRINLRKYGNCTPFASTDELVLNAGEDDPAQAREVVSAQLLDGLGLAASRAVFATLAINGESFGLYTLVENVDAWFIAHHFAEAGTLWEGEDDADFSDAGVSDWDRVVGTGDKGSVEAVVRLVQTAGDDFYAEADALVDMEQFLAHWAALAAVGHPKAYPYEPGDVFLFAPDSDPRFLFVPWQLDEGWDPGFQYNAVGGMLAVRCVYDATCDALLRSAVADALVAMDALDPAGIAAEAFALTTAEVAADPRRDSTAAEVSAAREALLTSMAGWTATVGGQLE